MRRGEREGRRERDTEEKEVGRERSAWEGSDDWKFYIHFCSVCRVTDDIVAMARPSSHLIKKYNIIEQFQR